MIEPGIFFDVLKRNNVDFFTGVPDSLLKDFCLFVEDTVSEKNHIIAANEGNAIGLAAGYHLATSGLPLVYMQNSGLGNAINPLTSLVDPKVYGIPMILLIGYRGEPTIPDEPQHLKMGQVTLKVLDAIGVPYECLSLNPEIIEKSVLRLIKKAKKEKCAVALVVKKGTFSKYTSEVEVKDLEMSRELALEMILDQCQPDDIVVSSTGKLSRELYEARERRKQSHSKDFLTVGSMGHSSQIALGISMNKSTRVICIDGDGSVIMHLGSLAINGKHAPKNFVHIVMNNACHESVGGQPTVGFDIDIVNIAKSCGYKRAVSVDNSSKLIECLHEILSENGPSLLEVRINRRSRKDLGRPKSSPADNKDAFMNFLKNVS